MDAGLPPSLLQALAAGAGTPWPPGSDAEADLLLAQAGPEGLLPLMFETPLPPVLMAARERQRAHHRLATRRAEILLQGLQRAVDALGDEPFVVWKGADYAQRLYPHPALRPMQDLDLLVPRARLSAACDRLEKAGARRRPFRGAASRASSYHERAFELGDVIVEVHQAFVQRARHRVDYDVLWARRVEAPALGPQAFRLDDTDALLAHALALAKDELTAPLVRYLDLRLLLERADVAEAGRRAREWRMVRALWSALHQARSLMPEIWTADVARVADALLPPRVRAFLARRVLPPPHEQGRAGAVTRTRQLWRKAWLMDGAWRRLAFAGAHAAALVEGHWRARREKA
jgi:hypothetical protein